MGQADQNTRNLRRFSVNAVRPSAEGVEALHGTYNVFIQDSDTPGQREYRFFGPHGVEKRSEGVVPAGRDERAFVEDMVRRWHPDATITCDDVS